jgi:hypothetical protein
MAKKQVEFRRLAYSDHHGIYLGDGHWSFINAGGKDIAPTFRNEIDAGLAMGRHKQPFRMIQAHPDVDKDGQFDGVPEADKLFCTQDAVTASGLPRWDPQLATGKPHHPQGSMFDKERRTQEVAEARSESQPEPEEEEPPSEPEEEEEEAPRPAARKRKR